MEREKIKITLLFDQANDWIAPFFDDFKVEERFILKREYDYKKVINQDIVFILGYTKILNNDFLNSNLLNLVIHESALPKGKGFAPLQWQILEGKTTVPISIIVASEKVDSGEIVFQDKIELDGNELYHEIRTRQAAATIGIIDKFLKVYPNIEKLPQSGEPSFYKRRTKKDSELDIDQSIKEQFNLLRIVNNEEWPAFFYHNKQKYILKIYKED